MAEKNKAQVDNKPAPAAQAEPDAHEQIPTEHDGDSHKGYVVAIIIAGSVALAFLGGAVIEHATYSRQHVIRPMGVGGFVMGGNRYGGPHGGGMDYRLNSSDSNSSRLNGVVTSVNGSTFVIAGHGATNSVQTTSSTQFTGGDKVAVNDSVSVIGTTNNGTFTASRVVISP